VFGHDGHREITTAQLKNCFNINQHYLCAEQAVWWREQSASCLSSLYYSSKQGIHAKCKVELLQDKTWVSSSQGIVWIFSKEEETFNRVCQNGTRETFRVHGLKKVRLGTQCRIAGDQYRVAASPFDEDVNAGHFATGDLLDAGLQALLPNLTNKDYQEAMEELGQLHLGSSVKVHQLLSQLDKQVAQLHQHRVNFIGAVIVVLLGGGILIVGALIAWRLIKHYRQASLEELELAHAIESKDMGRNIWQKGDHPDAKWWRTRRRVAGRPDELVWDDWCDYRKSVTEGFRGGFECWADMYQKAPKVEADEDECWD